MVDGIVLISKCLLGYPCRYDGKTIENEAATRFDREEKCLAVCPEQLGGLKTPRKPCEIIGGDGDDVLDGRAFVKTQDGKDFTQAYIEGAKRTLALCQQLKIKKAVLKAKSPSCGSCGIYDGSFTRTLRTESGGADGTNRPAGLGVTAALLLREGIDVVSEEDLPKL